MADVAVSAGCASEALPGSGRIDRQFWAGRRVLLTGHTGFKGAWLTLWLQALGAELVGLARGVPSEPSLFALAGVGDGLAHVEADIRDYDAVRGAVREHRPEVIIHMAAQPLVRASFDDPRSTYETNVMGTVNVLEAVRQSEGVRVVVNVTSDKCYENREWDWAYREYEPKGGHDPYSSSKGCAELVTDAFRRSFFSALQAESRVGSARAGNVIGGGDWASDRLLPDLMRAAIAGESVRLRNPQAVRPWQHVLCPLHGYLLLAQGLWNSAELADGWNLWPGDDDARPVGWIAERVAALWPEGLGVVMDEAPAPHEAQYLRIDSTRARRLLGWRPAWDLEQALAATVQWFADFVADADMRAATLRQIDAYQLDASLDSQRFKAAT